MVLKTDRKGTLTLEGRERKIFEQLLRGLDKKEILKELPGQIVLEIGRLFLGTPYHSETLKIKQEEPPLVNLREFDCVTFIENVLGLTLLLRSHKRSFKDYQRILQKIRYRDGRRKDYASRLHYFSDWIYNNQKKGFLRDITSEIGGRPFIKSIHYMTSHPTLYPPLKTPRVFQAIRSVERRISRRVLFLIPKKRVRSIENRIGDGDLIAITTHQEGLDVQHAGLAVRLKKRIHLLHASSTERKVVLSKKTLHQYLMENRDFSGIMVARIVY